MKHQDIFQKDVLLSLSYVGGFCLIFFWACVTSGSYVSPENYNRAYLPDDGFRDIFVLDIGILITLIRTCVAFLPTAQQRNHQFHCFDSTAFDQFAKSFEPLIGMDKTVENFQFYIDYDNVLCYNYDLVCCKKRRAKVSKCVTVNKLANDLLEWLANLQKAETSKQSTTTFEILLNSSNQRNCFFKNFLVQAIICFACVLAIALSFSICSIRIRSTSTMQELKKRVPTLKTLLPHICLISNEDFYQMMRIRVLHICSMLVFKISGFTTLFKAITRHSTRNRIFRFGCNLKEHYLKLKTSILVLLKNISPNYFLQRLPNLFDNRGKNIKLLEKTYFLKKFFILYAVSLIRSDKRKLSKTAKSRRNLRDAKRRLLHSKSNLHEKTCSLSTPCCSMERSEILTGDDLLSSEVILSCASSQAGKAQPLSQWDLVDFKYDQSTIVDMANKMKEGNNSSSWKSSSYEILSLSDNHDQATQENTVEDLAGYFESSLSSRALHHHHDNVARFSISVNKHRNNKIKPLPASLLNGSYEFVPMSFKSSSTLFSDDIPSEITKIFDPHPSNIISISENLHNLNSSVINNTLFDTNQKFVGEVYDDEKSIKNHTSTTPLGNKSWRVDQIFCRHSLFDKPKKDPLSYDLTSSKGEDNLSASIWSKNCEVPVLNSIKKSFKTESSFNFDDSRFDSFSSRETNRIRLNRNMKQFEQTHDEREKVLCDFSHMLNKSRGLEPSTRGKRSEEKQKSYLLQTNMHQWNDCTETYDLLQSIPKEKQSFTLPKFKGFNNSKKNYFETLFQLYRDQRKEIDTLRTKVAQDAIIISEHYDVLQVVSKERAAQAEANCRRSQEHLQRMQEEKLSRCNNLIEKAILKLHNLQKRCNNAHASEFKKRAALQWKPLELR